MDSIQAIVLALLQGLTEFLPISSSAHLILVPVISSWPDQGLAFDVAVHVGTLLAVTFYFRNDLIKMAKDWGLHLARRSEFTQDAKMAWLLVIATIPVGIIGISLPDSAEDFLRNPLVIAASTIVFALLLWWAQVKAKESRGVSQITWLDALAVGIFQAIALIPGTSRSGITMTGALMLGFDRDFAARFSFLMSVPVITLAGMVKTLELIQQSESVPWDLLLIGVLVSASVAYLTIDWFLKLLDRMGFMPFVIYRLILGVILFAIFLPIG